MLCDICGKNEATIHIEEISDGKSRTMHLCGECMAKNSPAGVLAPGAFNLAGLLADLTGKLKNAQHQHSDQSEAGEVEDELVCPVCHWSSRELRSTGLLGCPECFATFSGVLTPALSTMHRGVEHRGKAPRASALPEEDERLLRLSALRRELAECVKREDYEQAAILRDRINELTGKAVADER